MNDVSKLYDNRVNCWSLMTIMSVGDYLRLVEGAYHNRGGLRHQRDALKTTSGKRIRKRMVEDIGRGAVLPPVVVGVVITNDQIKNIKNESIDDIVAQVCDGWIENVSIIDGMQRTTAFLDAREISEDVEGASVRVEFWISDNPNSLIYRMLVLNSGQVPWNIKRQLQVVFSPLVDEIKKKVVLVRLITMEKVERRINGGEFSADNLVEAYLAFGVRRTDIDTTELLADEFSRLDMADAIASEKYNKYFYPIVQTLVDLDKAFSLLQLNEDLPVEDENPVRSKYLIGRNIFDSRPAQIGYIVACAVSVLGRLGMDRDADESQAALRLIQEGSNALVQRLRDMEDNERSNFLALDILGERLGGQKRSAVGRYERSFFENSFKVLLEENFQLPSMEVCWRT